MNFLHNLNDFSIKLTNQGKLQEANQLQCDLSEFGLCPKEWQIKNSGHGSYKIQNRTSPDFYFIGQTTKTSQKIKWQSIRLAGI